MGIDVRFREWLGDQYNTELEDIYCHANKLGYSRQLLRDNPILFLHIIRLLDKDIL